MNKEIILYPEVLASVLKNNEEDVFCLWLLSKKIDFQNNGLIKVEEILNIAKLCLNLNSTYVYSKLQKGIGLYWRQPVGNKGKKIVGLFSLDNIVKRLQPEITRSKPVILNLNILKSDTKSIRNLFISIVAGRYVDNRPISLASLSENMGLSERTIQEALRTSLYIKINPNFVLIAEDNLRNNLTDIIRKEKKSSAFRIQQNNEKFQLLKQIGNSYSLLDFDRLPLKKRPKCLKINDRILLDKLNEKRYNISNQTKLCDNQSIITYHM